MPGQSDPADAGQPDAVGARFRATGREAVAPRTLLLVLGVLVIQLGFIASYLGAFHRPRPHRVPVAVAVAAPAPASAARQAADELNNLPGDPVDARPVVDEAAVRNQIDDRTVYGGYVVSPSSGTDRLLVASAAGASVSQALTEVFARVAAQQGRRLAVADVVPAGAGDARGLSAFYLVIGWIIGGYLVASALTLARGAKPAHLPAAAIRLGALALYAVASGLGGALISEQILGALTHHFLALAAFGTLLVFAAGALTMGLQALTGIVGIGLVVVLFVVLGNPSAGGAYAWPLLPAFWRTIGPWLLPGSGTYAVRGIVYFHGAGLTQPLWLLAGCAVAGAAVTVAVAAARGHHHHPAAAP